MYFLLQFISSIWIFFWVIFPYGPLLKLCPVVAFILDFHLIHTKNHLSSKKKGPSKENFSQDIGFDSLGKNKLKYFPHSFLVTFAVWWWPSWILDRHKKLKVVRDHRPIIHLQFGFNQSYNIREEIFDLFLTMEGRFLDTTLFDYVRNVFHTTPFNYGVGGISDTIPFDHESEGVMVFNITFNNISVILRRSISLIEETGIPGENHWPAASHWQTSSHNVASSTPRHQRDSNSHL